MLNRAQPSAICLERIARNGTTEDSIRRGRGQVCALARTTCLYFLDAARFFFGAATGSLARRLRVPPSDMQWPPPWKISAGDVPGGPSLFRTSLAYFSLLSCGR